MAIKKLFIPLAAAAVLSACSSVSTQFSKMAEPDSGNRARVRIAANMLVRGMPETACIDWSKQGAGTVFGGLVGSSGYRGRSLNMPNPNNYSGRSMGEMYVRADVPVTYVLTNTPDSWMRCNIAITFTPQQGRDYELTMQTGRSGAFRSRCSAQVVDITDGGNAEVAVQMASNCR